VGAVGPRDDTWPIAPMKAVAGELPTSTAWMFEPKWDGHRALVRVHRGETDVVSSSGKPRAASWPWIADLRECLGPGGDDVVLDGEVVAMDETGRHRFEYVGDTGRPHALILFDILRLGGESLLARPWSVRREILQSTVTPAGSFSITPVHADGALLWGVVVAAGYEGVVAKRIDSSYAPGRRAPTWRKTKARQVQEFVVGGWLPGSGRRDGTLGSLLLGVHEPDGSLRFVGAVGSGFDDRALDVVRARLFTATSPACPFEPPPPRLVATRAASCVTPCTSASATTSIPMRSPHGREPDVCGNAERGRSATWSDEVVGRRGGGTR
jgi:bifunctional non-homologous end joining protein LigD